MEALLKQIESGKIETDKAKILNYIINNPNSTWLDIKISLNLLENTAGARISDLEDLGLIMPKYTKEQRGSNQSTYIYVSDEDVRSVLIKQRAEAKILKAVKKLMSFEDTIPEYLLAALSKYYYSLLTKEMLECSEFDINKYVKSLLKTV